MLGDLQKNTKKEGGVRGEREGRSGEEEKL